VKSPYYYKMTALRVIDGDSIEVLIDLGFDITLKEVVRLWDVDAPEIRGVNATPEGQRAKMFAHLWLCGREDKFGDPAEELWAMHTFRKDLYLDSRKYNAREKYGRILGVIYRGGEEKSLNDALLDKGLIK
jgi:micrococcal nuclease